MIDRVASTVMPAVAVGLPPASVTLAGGSLEQTLSEEHFEGTVTRVDAKGGATVITKEGREYTVQATGLQVGDTIACGQHRAGTCEKIPATPK